MNLKAYPEKSHMLCAVEGCTKAQEFWYPTLKQGRCGEHTLLADLDPEHPVNRRKLHGVPVACNFVAPLDMPLKDLFEKVLVRPTDKLDHIGQQQLLLSLLLPHSPRYRHARSQYPVTNLQMAHTPKVVPSQALLEIVETKMLYGLSKPLTNHYFLEIVERHDDQILLSLKYQQIIGRRYLGLYHWHELFNLLGWPIPGQPYPTEGFTHAQS